MASATAHKKFMTLAIRKAAQGIRTGQSPFGACIVKNGIVVSCCHNKVWKNTDSTAHAEIQAIRAACLKLKTVDLQGCTIYSTCEPCPMCFSACHWAKISTIVFGTKIADARRTGFSELSVSNRQMKRLGKSSLKIIPGVMKSESLRLFSNFAKHSEGKLY